MTHPVQTVFGTLNDPLFLNKYFSCVLLFSYSFMLKALSGKCCASAFENNEYSFVRFLKESCCLGSD